MKHCKLTSLLLTLSMLALSAAPAFAKEQEKTSVPSVNVTSVTAVDGIVTRTVFDGEEVITDTYIIGTPTPSATPAPEESPEPSASQKESEPETTSDPATTAKPEIATEVSDALGTDTSVSGDEIIDSVTADIGNALYNTLLFKMIKQYVNQCIEEYLHADVSAAS